jgi:hypothetical protein
MVGELHRVYVSSTYKDLVDLRARVVAAIGKLPAFHAVNMENYAASTSTPLEKCLRDVRECDIYVGIIGWRAGFVPEGQQLPITQLEYRAALDAGMPCLFLLLKGKPPAPKNSDDEMQLALVHAYRAEVSTRHTVREVKEKGEIGEDVMAGLFDQAWRKPGVSRDKPPDVPPLLPYLCNRTDQQDALALAARRRPVVGEDSSAAAARGRIPICVLHGTPEQAPHQFLEWLSARLFRKLLGVREGLLEEYRVAWPAAHAKGDDFLFLLAKNLADAAQIETPEGWQPGDLIAALEQLPDYYLSIVLSIDHWSDSEAQRLQLAARYFDDWPSTAHAPRAVLFWLTYKSPPSLAWLPGRGGAAAKNETVRKALEALKDGKRIAVVRELGNVLEHDAAQWACDPEVVRFVGGTSLEKNVRKLFAGALGRPMESAADEFRKLLKRPPQDGNGET